MNIIDNTIYIFSQIIIISIFFSIFCIIHKVFCLSISNFIKQHGIISKLMNHFSMMLRHTNYYIFSF